MRIFVLKREEVTGDWRKLRSEEICGKFSSVSVNIFTGRKVKLVVHTACIW
jgi:hypothetical protein